MIWNTESNFKENVLNVFGIEKLESQYEENICHHNNDYADNSDYCFICYDILDATMKKQTKKCVNEMCDALYHMACICEVNFYFQSLSFILKIFQLISTNTQC